MHELGYTRDIIDTVLAAAERSHATEVRGVYLVVGEARDIVDDLFQKCFKHFTKGTIAENATVELKRVPFTVRCKGCGTVYPISIRDDASLICPTCGAQDYKLETGMEFYIDRVEIV